MSKPLTKQQKEVLEFLKSFSRQKGYMPTVREICKELGRAPSSVQQLLKYLSVKGYIRTNGMPRGIEIIDQKDSNLRNSYITHELSKGIIRPMSKSRIKRPELPIYLLDMHIIFCIASNTSRTGLNISKDDILLLKINESASKPLKLEESEIIAILKILY